MPIAPALMGFALLNPSDAEVSTRTQTQRI
jgi:hypothetical protein